MLISLLRGGPFNVFILPRKFSNDEVPSVEMDLLGDSFNPFGGEDGHGAQTSQIVENTNTKKVA